MWSGDLYSDDFNLDDFNKVNNAQVQGTWGQLSGRVGILGIVGFLPDDATAVPEQTNRGWTGNILVIGLAACQWAPEGTNEFAYNLKDMTFNAINYLAKKLEKEPVNTAIDAPDYTYDDMGVAGHDGMIVYRNVPEQSVMTVTDLAGRVMARVAVGSDGSVSLPVTGLVIVSVDTPSGERNSFKLSM